MKHLKSVLSALLAAVMLLGSIPVVVSANDGGKLQLTEVDPAFDPRMPELFVSDSEDTEPAYARDDIVRVSIVLEKVSAIDRGYSVKTIGRSKSAAEYRRGLLGEQKTVTEQIEKTVLNGKKLSVAANLTLVANLISADVEYGQIGEIEKVPGVKEVVIEQIYEPFEAIDGDGAESGTAAALAEALAEYTGTGSRIAVIDSGVRDDHQSFSERALDYALRQSAPDLDGNGDISDDELLEYKKTLGFMLPADVEAAVAGGQLNAVMGSSDAAKFYVSGKVPFAYNYADNNFSVRHTGQSVHGSHVSGIAAANTYIEKNGSFVKAADDGAMTGRAPDAQILNLKVFGTNICTDSVIARAIEDSVVLGADVLNLSLGTSEVGFSCADEIYGDILGKLTEQGVVVIGAVGNDGSWVSSNAGGRPNKLYVEDVNMSTDTPPSSFADLIGVAWSNGGNAGATVNDKSSYGIPSSLMLSPEITANGTDINSVNGATTGGYKPLSGTSMAAPDVAGAAAVIAQYLRTPQEQFGNESFLARVQAQNIMLNKGMLVSGLLMSTATPMKDENGRWYSLLRQGAGLLNAEGAVSAKSFIAIKGQPRGRVKAEVGDSPDGSNVFTYTFTLYNVSSAARSYTFRTELFTEDTVTEGGIDYLADVTRTLAGDVIYMIGGKEVKFDAAIDADVNKDGVTDAEDAQALLDYLSGSDAGDIDLLAADADGDGEPTTYDAHLILENLMTSAVTVDAGSSVTVEVTVKVTEDIKKTYPNGTYLEGFTSVVPISREDEEADVTHTIPILGFCGNWSDPSMFDRNSYIESSNGTNTTVPYTKSPGSVYSINYMTYQDESGKKLMQSANPFASNLLIPPDRLAMRMSDTVYSITLTLIRPAGAMCFAIMKDDGNGNRKVLHIESLYIHQPCAYPSPNSTGGWNFSSVSLSVRASLAKMLAGCEINEGDTIEIGAVAVPEYYEKTPGTTIDRVRMTELIESGALGKGAYLTTEVKIDNTAPKITHGEEVYGQKISVTAEDDQDVAYIGLYSANGSYAFGNYAPGSDITGKTLSCEFSVKSLQEGGLYYLVVGDYAGNTRMYRFNWKEKKDISDRVVAYVRSYSSGQQINRGDWIAVKPDAFAVNASGIISPGVIPFAYTDPSMILAGADAADGYMWQAFEDGILYAAPLGDLNSRSPVCDLSAAGMKTVRDLSFSTGDRMLYATDGTDTLWRIDPMRGTVKAVQNVVTESGKAAGLYGLVINDSGTAYATSYDDDSGTNSLLVWQLTKDDAPAAKVTAKRCALDKITGRYISMTRADSGCGEIYAASAESLDNTGTNNYMYRIYAVDPEGGTCAVDKTNQGFGYEASLLFGAVRGLVNMATVPAPGVIGAGSEISGVNILGAKETMMQGETAALRAVPVPWNFSGTVAVSWQSGKTSVAAVDRNGLLTAVGAGTATVTAACTAPNGQKLTASFDVEVTPAPSVDVAALFREGDGKYYWESFNTATPNDRKRVSGPQRSFTVGTLNHAGDCLYLFGGFWGYRVDPATFIAEPLESSISKEYFHGDAAPGSLYGLYNDFGYLTVIDGSVYLFGGDLYGSGGFTTVAKSMRLAKADISGPAAGICYKEYVPDYSTTVSDKTDKGADVYYVLSEDGELYELYIYSAPKTSAGYTYDFPTSATKRIGKVEGVSLPGVSKMQGDVTASMIYDSKSDSLVLINKSGLGAAKVSVIDPKTHTLLMTREFDEDVREVSVLYQYDYSGFKDLQPEKQGQESISGNIVTFAAEAVPGGTVTVDAELGTVTVGMNADGTTNGLTSLTYDPSILTFAGLTASMPYHSFSNDAGAGVVKFAFADAGELNGAEVNVRFTYEPKEEEQTAKLTFKEEERGDPKAHPAPEIEEQTVTLPAKPAARTLTGIEITHGPNRTEYLEGDEKINVSGLEVSAVYSDGTYEILDPTEYTVSGYSPEPGTHTVTVKYLDYTDTFEITVKPKTLTEIAVTKMPDKTEYIEGTEFDDAGMELTLTHDNGTSETVRDGWDIEYSFDKIGKSEVTVIYEGMKTTLEVTVIEKSLVSIAVTKMPDKTEYIEGTEFDDAGMELTLTYDNGTTETVKGGWDIEYSFDKIGKSEVTVTYGGKTTTLTVKVTAKSLTGIKITTLPEKLVYLEGADAPDLRGGVLTLYYNNGTSEEIGLEESTVTGGFDGTKPGKQTVTVTYGGFTAAFEITVRAKEIDRIEISGAPDKTEYVEGTKFDPKGMEVTVYYNNGDTEVLTGSWEVAYSFDKVGKSDVTVSYRGHEAVLTVNVVAKTLTRIEITKLPAKTEYTENGVFDGTGMEVTLYYDNRTSKTVTEGWTLDYDFGSAGRREVKVRVGAVETSFTVTVTRDVSGGNVPQTGDSVSLCLPILILASSAAGILALLVPEKKRRGHN